jgi:hypothetical protein
VEHHQLFDNLPGISPYLEHTKAIVVGHKAGDVFDTTIEDEAGALDLHVVVEKGQRIVGMTPEEAAAKQGKPDLDTWRTELVQREKDEHAHQTEMMLEHSLSSQIRKGTKIGPVPRPWVQMMAQQAFNAELQAAKGDIKPVLAKFKAEKPEQVFAAICGQVEGKFENALLFAKVGESLGLKAAEDKELGLKDVVAWMEANGRITHRKMSELEKEMQSHPQVPKVMVPQGQAGVSA